MAPPISAPFIATRKYRGVIEFAAGLHGLPPLVLPGWIEFEPAVWLEALIMQESSGSPEARRYEPRPDVSSPRDPDTPHVDDGIYEDDASYGLMQIMGWTYKDLVGIPQATRVNFGVLFDPVLNLGLGTLYLGKMLDQTGYNAARAMCRYNGGSQGDHVDATGEMRNIAYVHAVLRRIPAVIADRQRF